MTHETLLRQVWHDPHGDSENQNVVRTYVRRLRDRLDDDTVNPNVHLHSVPHRLPHARSFGSLIRASAHASTASTRVLCAWHAISLSQCMVTPSGAGTLGNTYDGANRSHGIA